MSFVKKYLVVVYVPPGIPPRLSVEDVLDLEGFDRLPELEAGFSFCGEEDRGAGFREGDL